MSAPLFSLGSVYATPGALTLLAARGMDAQALLMRHQTGDWGDLDPHDQAMNQQALASGDRILSRYVAPDDTPLYVITEAVDDAGVRTTTTILRADEY
jgi:hypothetical protein